MYRRKAIIRGLLIAAVAVPMSARAQPMSGDGFLFGPPSILFTASGGFARPTASSDVFSDDHKFLTLGKNDFSTASFSGNLSIRVTDRWYVQLNGGYSGRTVASEFRDWVDNDDRPIEQTTELRRVPIMAGVRYYLRNTGRSLGRLAWVPTRVAPYVSVGAGAMWYNYQQTGDFVDFETLAVFNSTLKSSSWTPAAYAAAGFDISLHPAVSLTSEVRFDEARARMSADFENFNRIDLSGVMATVGLSFRY